MEYDTPENWKICPDKFLLNLAHLIGGSAIVYAPWSVTEDILKMQALLMKFAEQSAIIVTKPLI